MTRLGLSALLAVAALGFSGVASASLSDQRRLAERYFDRRVADELAGDREPAFPAEIELSG